MNELKVDSLKKSEKTENKNNKDKAKEGEATAPKVL